MYTIVTDKTYIPHSSSGSCNFLVLEKVKTNDNTENEPKYIYILLDSITSIDIISDKKKSELRMYVLSRPNYISIKDDQRTVLFEIINNYLDDDDSDNESD